MSFKTLETLSHDIAGHYPDAIQEDQAWVGSPFNWMRALPPGRKGAIGRKLASGLLRKDGFLTSKKRNLIQVNGASISVKTSFMWGAGVIKFQNIRNSDFDFLLCLGIYPNASFGWVIPKMEIWDNGVLQERTGIRGQHGGIGADDAWIGIDPDHVPDWVMPYGGTTDAMLKVAHQSFL